MKDLLLWAGVVVRTLVMKISRPCQADYVQNLYQIVLLFILFQMFYIRSFLLLFFFPDWKPSLELT